MTTNKTGGYAMLNQVPGKEAARILVADDDLDARDLVRDILERAGFEVALAQDGAQALELWKKQRFDLILLDMWMPGLDGLETCRTIRRVSDIPIVFLTAWGEEQAIIEGFQAGAQDYIVKPFRAGELVARLRAHILYCVFKTDAGQQNLIFEDLNLDLKSHLLQRNGYTVPLSPNEFSLLNYFMQHRGEVIPKDKLLQNIWGCMDLYCANNLVETAIKRLRKKIEDNPKKPRYLHTIWGGGYCFGCTPTIDSREFIP